MHLQVTTLQYVNTYNASKVKRTCDNIEVTGKYRYNLVMLQKENMANFREFHNKKVAYTVNFFAGRNM